MENNIDLQEYSPIVANEVFERKADIIEHLGEKWKAKQLITLKKFKVPTVKEVFSLIRETAKTMDLSSLNKDRASPERLKATYFLALLPDVGIKEIAKGDKETMDHLQRHYTPFSLQPERTYLEVSSGVVPSHILKEEMKKKNMDYDLFIAQMCINQFNLRMRLEKNGAVPDRKELEYLLDRGVRVSDVFLTKGDVFDYQIVADHVRTMSKALDSPDRTSKVKDVSHKILEGKASSVIQTTAACLGSETFANDLSGGLAGVIEKIMHLGPGINLGHMPNQPQTPLDYKGDCSLN